VVERLTDGKTEEPGDLCFTGRWLIVPGLKLLHFARAQPAEVAKNVLIIWVAWRIG